MPFPPPPTNRPKFNHHETSWRQRLNHASLSLFLSRSFYVASLSLPAPGDEWQCIDLYLWKGKIHETFCEHFSQGNPQKKAPFFHGQNAPSQQENIFFLRANFPGRIPSNSPHSLRILRSPMSHWLPFKQLPISRAITGCWRMQFCLSFKGIVSPDFLTTILAMIHTHLSPWQTG